MCNQPESIQVETEQTRVDKEHFLFKNIAQEVFSHFNFSGY